MDPILSGEPLDGKYRIDKLLGEGGMGAVYRASHLGTTRSVAIKIIHPRFSHDPAFVERFRREAEAAGRLRHPNVVDVTDFGFAPTRTGQVAYLVMEYLDRRTLSQVLEQEGRLSTGWIVDILEQVCSAVDEAHRLGIVHRDLKPDNIWLEPNRRGGFTVKVLDFGLARLGDAAPSAAAAPGLAGEPPFSGDGATRLKLHCEQPPPELRGRGIPRRLAALVMTALAKDPRDRPDSAAGFGSALRAGAEGSGALLRHAVALYSEHFPAFFKLSLLANGPLIVSATAVAIADMVTPDGSTAPFVNLLIILSMVGSNLFAFSAINAATVPLVVS